MKLNYSFQYIWINFCVLKKRPWYKTQLKLNLKNKNKKIYIFVFAQYFSNTLFWVPHIAEITKSTFYEFDFICMKNAISHISFHIAPWKNEWLFEKNIMTHTLVEIWHVLFDAIGWGMKKMIKFLVFICAILGGTFFDIFIYLWGNVEKKWFSSFNKGVYTLVIIVFEIYFNLVFKDFPGRRRAKCTKLSRCCFWQCSCKLKFAIFSQKFCPRNKLFWNSFSQRYLW